MKSGFRTDISMEQVAQHCTPTDCWIVCENKVYDVTKYLHDHPGGVNVLQRNAGGDATEAFRKVGHSSHAIKTRAELLIGYIEKKKIPWQRMLISLGVAGQLYFLLEYLLGQS